MLNNIDAIGISETWLTSSVSDSYVSIPGFDIVRNDSPDGVRKHGVALYIKNSLRYTCIDCPVKNCVVVYLLHYNVYLITVYRPPSYNDSENRNLYEFLLSFCNDKEVILQGDFNLPTLKWETSIEEYISVTDKLFNDLFIALGLTQIISLPTIFPSGNILDLILLSHDDRIGKYEVLPPLPNCAHCSVSFSYIFQDGFLSNNLFNSPMNIWNKGNYYLFGRHLDEIDWIYV